MEIGFNIVTGLLSLSALAYLAILSIMTKGWFRIDNYVLDVLHPGIEVSVIIAVRNEERNIIPLLESLHKQSYARHLIEVIIVDDHSEDNTRQLIGQFRKQNRLDNIILSKPKGIGKKAAITHGVKLATGQLILTTDGDCVLPPDWLKLMVSYYLDHKPGLIIGPVIYHKEKGWLQKLFSLDFLSLVASGAGSIGAKLPLMGNGANMAFPRKAFLEIESSMQGKGFASGDDVFLIHQMTKQFGSGAIHFIKHTGVIVRTMPPRFPGEFLSQRLRWASKAKGDRSGWSVVVPLVVTFFNTFIVLEFVNGFFSPWYFTLYGLFLFLKIMIDLPIMYAFMFFSDMNGKGERA
ncbi:MAG: glycosyltransferase [bacterium]